MLKISVCSKNCKKACWKFQHVLKTVMHVVCLKFQCIKTMLNISGCVENMLKISRHVENYNMCRKLCWNSMLQISACVEHCNGCWNHVKTSRCIENVYVRHVENHIENHVEVRKKDHHTLWHMSKLSARFHFSPSVLHELLKWDIFIHGIWQHAKGNNESWGHQVPKIIPVLSFCLKEKFINV